MDRIVFWSALAVDWRVGFSLLVVTRTRKVDGPGVLDAGDADVLQIGGGGMGGVLGIVPGGEHLLLGRLALGDVDGAEDVGGAADG